MSRLKLSTRKPQKVGNYLYHEHLEYPNEEEVTKVGVIELKSGHLYALSLEVDTTFVDDMNGYWLECPKPRKGVLDLCLLEERRIG